MFAGIGIRLLILGLLALACLTTGFVSGVQVEGWKRDAQQKELLAEAAKLSQSIITHDHTVEVRYVDRAAQRDVEREKLTKEVQSHAALADPVDCWLAPERVRDINTAFGLVDDQRSGNGPVPAGKPTGVRLPSSLGGLGRGAGLQVPGVRGQAGAARGDDPAAPKG